MKSRNILLTLLLILSAMQPLWAQRSTTYTYTPNPKGEGRYIRTGDAYLPEFTLTSLGLKEPQDMFIDPQDQIIIADSGNRRILIYDIASGKTVGEINHEALVYPSGIWISTQNIMYVADPKAKKVFCFNSRGELLRQYERPDEIAFGDRDFAPRKVAVDEAGNLFIIGEGLYDGVIQLSPDGTFLGYFTSNKIELSFVERLQDMLFTEAQKANLLDRSPITFSNLFIDSRNILFTSSIGDESGAVKKHNAAGAAIVKGPARNAAPVDLWVTPDEIIIAVFARGETVLYSREGDVIATFGYSYNNEDIAGLFSTPSSVAVDSRGALWFLDEEKSFLQSYQPTEYIQSIYTALDLFEDGEYQASIDIWKEVLKVNQISRIAHLSIGKNYLFLRDYAKAMYHTRIANSREFYSESFWEIRNIWLQKNVIYLVLLILLLFIIGPLYRYLRKHLSFIEKLERPVNQWKKHPLIDGLLLQFRVIKRPNDSFYMIRTGKRGSMLTASLIMLGFFALFMLYIGAKGFIYQEVQREDIDFTSVIIGFVGGIFLFLFSNYLGTSINDGRGDMKDLYMMFAYTLAPLAMAMGLVVGLSYILTLNEIFVLQLIMNIGWVWWLLLLVLGLREVHEYSTGAALMSIVFSLVFMLVLLIVIVIISVMAQQVYQFFLAIGKELFRNVL